MESYEFLGKFRDPYTKLGHFVELRPVYKFKNMIRKGADDFLRQHCYSSGRFCAVDQEYFESLSILEEGLRQKCIFNIGIEGHNNNKLWWDYVLYYRVCLKKAIFDRKYQQLDCYPEVYESINLPKETQDKIDQCMQKSWSSSNDKFSASNEILENDENSAEYRAIYLVPAVFVNENLVKEDLNPRVVVSAVCDRLMSKPDYCSNFITDHINWTFQDKSNKSGKTFVILSILLIAVMSMAIALYLIRRSMNYTIQVEINDDVKNHISEYMKLRNSR